MLKSELVALLAARYHFPSRHDVERIVNIVLEAISKAMARGQRVELRGFGSFSVKDRPARVGRNPRNGTPVSIAQKCRPYFRSGKETRDRLID